MTFLKKECLFGVTDHHSNTRIGADTNREVAGVHNIMTVLALFLIHKMVPGVLLHVVTGTLMSVKCHEVSSNTP